MKCKDCGTEMKALATSVYCPNDCDRKVQQEIDPEKTPKLINWKTDFVGPPAPASSGDSTADPDLDWSWMDDMNWGPDTD